MDWPVGMYALIEAGARTDALAVCVAHRGAHCWYEDGCQALPPRRAPFSAPLERCREDPSCRLAAGMHVHAPPTRVELDVDALAEAIVRASRAARADAQPKPPDPIPPAASPPPRADPPRRVLE